MTKKNSKGTALTGAELAQFGQFHADIALAAEKLAHSKTQARLVQTTHELAAMRLSATHNATLRHQEQRDAEREADVQAAKDAAKRFAEHLASAYDVDMKTHGVCPLTGTFVPLPEDSHG